jgi:hypothetical protein
MQHDNSDDSLLDEPPRHDMMSVKFRGDAEVIILPYCEVANGNISKIDSVERHITIVKEDSFDPVIMTFESFVKVVEETFDIKEVVQLSLQKAESYDNITIL